MVASDTLEQLRTEPEPPKLDLSWLNLDNEWGVAAAPGRKGLTVEAINLGTYGEVPARSDNHTFAPRGAQRSELHPRMGYVIEEAVETYSESAALLYDEAVARQWSSATDIPWETIEELPEAMERAMCQLCTSLTEVEFIAGDVPGRWLPKISADHFESALFLMTQVMDEARHTDVFRKRALVNGGGLLHQGGGGGLRQIMECTDFSQMSAMLHILGEGFVQTLFRMGELLAHNEAEKRIFRLAAQDESRHVAYGVTHLKYLLANAPERAEEIHFTLDLFEGVLMDPEQQNPGLASALVYILGDGDVDEGTRILRLVRQKQVQEYLHRLDVAGLPDRRERMHPRLAKAIAAA
ncbi:MAG: ferritin-like domain-containing protein [Dehalococcoidia bacterium]